MGDMMISEDLKQLWKISLSMTSTWGSEKDFEIMEKFKPFWKKVNQGKLKITSEILHGVPESSSSFFTKQQNSRVKTFLQKVFYISDEDSFRKCLTYFFNGTNIKKSFEDKRNLIIAFPPKERSSYINSFSQQHEEYGKLSIINQYCTALPSAGIMAYDISNCVSICRLGLCQGYLKESELAAYLDPLALMAQENYSSFEEFGLSSIVGLLYSMDKVDEKAYNYCMDKLKMALTHPQSYWNNIDWKLNLS